MTELAASPERVQERPLFDASLEDDYEEPSSPVPVLPVTTTGSGSARTKASEAISTLESELARSSALDNSVDDNFDVEAVQAEAAARHKVFTMLQQNTSRYSQPDAKKKPEKTDEPKRKPIPKLNTIRLLDDSGFPALLKVYKNFKPKGKGHEAEDLTRLLQMYQFWTHQMFPKMQFDDAVNRIEKLCHEKRMLSALSVWRDGLTLTTNDPDSDEPMEDQDGDGETRPQNAVPAEGSAAAPVDDDDADWHTKLLGGSSSHNDDGNSTASRSSSVQPPPTSEDEFSAAELEAIDAIEAAERAASTRQLTNQDFEMDDDEWDLAGPSDDAPILFGQDFGPDEPASDAPSATNQTFPDDMDVFDIFGDEPDLPPVVFDSNPPEREPIPASDKHIAPSQGKVLDHDEMDELTQEELDMSVLVRLEYHDHLQAIRRDASLL